MKILKWEDPQGNDLYYLWSYRLGMGFEYDLAIFSGTSLSPKKGCVEITLAQAPSFFKKCVFQYIFEDHGSHSNRIRAMVREE